MITPDFLERVWRGKKPTKPHTHNPTQNQAPKSQVMSQLLAKFGNVRFSTENSVGTDGFLQSVCPQTGPGLVVSCFWHPAPFANIYGLHFSLFSPKAAFSHNPVRKPHISPPPTPFLIPSPLSRWFCGGMMLGVWESFLFYFNSWRKRHEILFNENS